MNKKGFLLAEQVLKIVLSLIALSFLIYFLTSLYFANAETKNKQQAELTLEEIKDLTKTLPTEFTLLSPKGWYLFSFTGEPIKPNSCLGENCLCICKNVGGLNPFKSEEERQRIECDNSGVCSNIKNLGDYDKEIEIKIPGEIKITEESWRIFVK